MEIIKAGRSFNYNRILSTIALVLLALSFAGCSTDPVAKRQKFILQGDREFAKGKLPEAVIYYSRAIQIDKSSAEAHFKLAKCFIKQKSWGNAYQELMKTVENQPDNQEAQLELGKLLLAGGRAREARDRAVQIITSNPKNADAQLLLAAADTFLGNLKDAATEAKDAIALAPDRSSAYIALALIQERLGKFDEAEQNLKQALSQEKTSNAPLMSLGGFYERQRRWPEAEKQFQSAIQLAPKDPLPRAALAGLYVNQGREDLAEKTLEDGKKDLGDNPDAYRMLGDFYLTRGDSAKALKEFAATSVQHPNDAQLRKTYIQLLVLNDRIDDAAQMNGEILKKSPQDPDALILQGQILLRQKKVDDALTSFQQGLKNAPDNAFGHYDFGVAYREKGKLEQAEGEWREAVRLRPALPQAWRALADAALRRQDWRNLEDISNQLKKYAPRSPDWCLEHATARFNQGDAAGAEADLNALLLLAPQSPIAYVKLGQMRAAQRRWKEGEAYYRQALERYSHSLEAVSGLTDIYFRQNRTADALKVVREQIDRDPNNPALYLLQGQSFLRANQSAEAEKALQRAADVDKRNPFILGLLAQAQANNGEADQAILTYQRAIELAPDDPRFLLNLGTLYGRKGNWQEAQVAYQKVLALKPDEPLASNNLAYLLLEHGGNVNVALTLAQAAHKGLPNLPNSADTLGWAYYNSGAFSVAAPLFEDAVKKVPNNQTYRYHLGLTYKKLNDPSRAKVELEKAIKLNPTSPLADQARHALSEMTGG
jgi:tetratricopeptide (TPR) repeat protein